MLRRFGLLPGAELEPARVLPAHRVVDGIAAQQHVDLAPAPRIACVSQTMVSSCSSIVAR